MLKYSRWQTAAILGVTAFFCLAAVPNVLPARALAALPAWASRTVPLGYDLQGGTSLQLEVDAQNMRKRLIESLRDDVRRTLREARIGYAGLTVRGDTLEVRVREGSDLSRARERLSELVGPIPVADVASNLRSSYVGVLPGEVSVTAVRRTGHIPPARGNLVVEGELIRLTLNPAEISQRITQGRDVVVERWSRSLNEVGIGSVSVRSVGSDRAVLELPGITDATRLFWHY
jgi:preprotein translocase subunit SecD